MLCLAFAFFPAHALADETNPSPSPSPIESPVPEEPTPAPSPTPVENEGPGENREDQGIALAASSLLIVGGHKTYMNGAPGGYFNPNNPMTRAEAAQMLYNLLAAKPAVTKSQFPDVSLDVWYGKAVNALAQVKVFSGYKDGTFGPSDNISRAEFVTAVCRCFSISGGESSFPDVPQTHWAYKYIAAAASKGWVLGGGDGNFQPSRNVTRAEAVTIMNAALERKGDGFAADRETQKFKDVPKSHWAYLQVAEAAEPVEAADPTPSPSEDPVPSGAFSVGDTLRVTADSGLNVRSQPTTSSTVVTVLSKGSVLTVTNVSKMPWLGIKTASGLTGYVHSDYVEAYTPVAASGARLSNSTLSLHQYQSARLDASLSSGSLLSMSWSSSDPSVAVVGYTLDYGSTMEQGAIVYGKKPGKAVLTFSNPDGKTKASCTVTVTAPEGVRYAYASENSAVKGKALDMVAVTDTSRSSVTFKIVSGPATGTYTVKNYTTESHSSKYGLPTNTVRVFKYNIALQASGTYTVRASAGGASDYQEFQVFVRNGSGSVTATSYEERRCTTAGLNVIANFEGSVPEVEDDIIAAKNPTVGYGYVVPVGGTFYNNLTKTELFGMLVDTVNHDGYSSGVNRFRSNNNLKMSQAQFDALVSFVFNCGTAPLNSSSYDFPKTLLNAVVPPTISESRPCAGAVNVTKVENNVDLGTPLYQSASASSKELTRISRGSNVTVTGVTTLTDKKQIWYKVKAGSHTGYLPAGVVSLNTSGLVHDLAYADAAAVSNNLMQWHKSNGRHIEGLLTRRLAEAKIFFFGNYSAAYHSSSEWGKNTYGFLCPDCCANKLK